MFGETEYDSTQQYSSVDIEEQLDALGRAVDAGKIRYIGVSNETPYGVMKFLHAAQRVAHYPKIVCVQNSYSLLNRTFDSGLAECCHHEGISLLAYSPLAMGILSGKYFSPDGGPPDARLNLFKGRYLEGESRYNLSKNTVKAAAMEYLGVAKDYGINPVHLAIRSNSISHWRCLLKCQSEGLKLLKLLKFVSCSEFLDNRRKELLQNL